MKKAIIVYYSYSGNTKIIAEALKISLGNEYSSDIVRLEALDESDKFIVQAVRALFKKQAQVKKNMPIDLSVYDLVCIGTPVWAFGPAPAARTFLNNCTGLAGKRVVLFSTYGSGAGKNKCMREMETMVKDKGAIKAVSFLIQQMQVKVPDKFKAKIEEALAGVSK
ncbi:MAG: flavodoxin family protein [Candidatus Omnitrophota bacterium]